MTRASSLYGLLRDHLGFDVPLRVRTWDGSEAGPTGAPVLVLRNRRALRHLVHQPGELGAARAYVSGDLDLEGDVAQALRSTWLAWQDAGSPSPRLRAGTVTRGAALAVRLGAVGRRPTPPAAEARLTGELHTRERDRAAISHHYDLSNDFYSLLLDPTMAYSSGFHTRDDQTLQQAQEAKLELVCRKLGLEPGMRMVDIGCGWGSLTLHAAQHHGVHVTGVTLSSEQRDFVLARAAERGIADRVDVSLRHYRDLHVPEGQIDAIASIEMGEHVGDAEYPDFTGAIARYLRPGGRVLIQQMSRRGARPGGGPFIETYIAPDMHMKPLHRTIELIAGAGLEIADVQAMREHYPKTVAAWSDNLESRWDEAVKLVGEEVARVWRLYLAGGSLAFEQNRMGVDQILAVKTHANGRSDLPASPSAWLEG